MIYIFYTLYYYIYITFCTNPTVSTERETPAFLKFCLSISAPCLCHEWFILLAFLHRPQRGVENWMCPDSHTCTHSRTHANLILESFFGTAKVTSITHILTLPSFCKTKTGKLISLFLCGSNFSIHSSNGWVNFAVKTCLECSERDSWELKM